MTGPDHAAQATTPRLHPPSVMPSFFLATLATIFMLDGCDDPPAYSLVTNEEYVDLKRCWTVGTHQHVYLAIRPWFDKKIPYLISPFCDTEVQHWPKGRGVLQLAEFMYLAEDNGIFRKQGYLPFKLNDNIETHIPILFGPENMYAVELILQEYSVERFSYYRFRHIVKFCDMKMSVDDFLKLTYRERDVLARNPCPRT